MTGRILGVDPGGVSGGWAVLDELGQIISAGDLAAAGTGAKRIISAPLFAAVVERFKPARAVLERVSAMPGQGVSSSFKFGRGLGVIEGVLGAEMVPVSYVSPVTWKRHFQLDKEKENARQLAINTWPRMADALFGRVKDHGRAEAALIALWGVRAEIAGGAR